MRLCLYDQDVVDVWKVRNLRAVTVRSCRARNDIMRDSDARDERWGEASEFRGASYAVGNTPALERRVLAAHSDSKHASEPAALVVRRREY